MASTGGCLCGGVRFTIAAPLAPLQVCHCRQCQRAQGGAFVAVTVVEAAAFALTAGDDLIEAFVSSPGKQRVFCRRCGSPLFSRRADRPGVLRVRAGAIDAPLGVAVARHAHVASAADWWPLPDDGAPRFEGAADETIAPVVLRAGVPADAEAVAALIASFQAELTADPQGFGAEGFLASVSAEAERDLLASARYRWVVAEAGTRLVGCAALRDGTHLFHLFVARSHQRQGLARQLWHAVRGTPVQPVTVNAAVRALPAYRALGFVPAGVLTLAHGIVFLPMQTETAP
jgi:GNAT superfamily N-acetyltransferase